MDGYVSLEVPPDVTYDAAATVRSPRGSTTRPFPDLLVKDPRHAAGPDRHGRGLAAGIELNVTLLFSDTHYLRTPTRTCGP